MIQAQQAVPLLPRQPFLEEDSILDPSIIGDQQFLALTMLAWMSLSCGRTGESLW